MTITFVLLVLGSYLVGSVPAAYLAARWSRQVDIRKYGSGNVGATNLLSLTSGRTAIPVIIFDLVKGMVMVWATQQLGLGIAEQVLVGLMAIVGHNWPIFLGFGGGRGVLTTLGVAFILPTVNGLIPWGIIIGLIIAAAGLFIFHNMPLGVGVSIAALPLISWGFGEPVVLTMGFLAIFLITVIRRLTVARAAIAASVSRKELLLNRLLFDRDIRDRKAWTHRIPQESASTKPPMRRQGK